MQNILSLLGGLIVGVLFSTIKLPIPAPPTLSGLLGIVGVYLGYQLLHFIKTLL
jgi:XapX domain-containing protein